MTQTEKQALKTIAITLLLLLAATSLLFAGAQERVITKTFTPDSSRPLLLKVHGDAGDVKIERVIRGREGRARYRYDEDRYSGTMEWDPELNRLETTIDMDGVNYDKDEEDNESELEILLPRTSPVDLDLSLKAGMVYLDGDGLEFSGLELMLWAGELQAVFPTPSGGVIPRANVDVKLGELNLEGLGNLAIELLDINCTAGMCTVDLTGSVSMKREVRVDLELGEITVIVPKGAAVEARISKLGFLAEVNIPDGWSKNGRYAYSPSARRGEVDLRLDIRGGIGEINIEER